MPKIPLLIGSNAMIIIQVLRFIFYFHFYRTIYFQEFLCFCLSITYQKGISQQKFFYCNSIFTSGTHNNFMCVCVCVCVCMQLHILYLSQYFNKIAILCYEIIWNKVNNQILTSWGKFSQDVSWNVTGCISACFMFVYLFGGKRQHKEY